MQTPDAARSLDRECPKCCAAPGERCKDTAFEGTTHFERLPRTTDAANPREPVTLAMADRLDAAGLFDVARIARRLAVDRPRWWHRFTRRNRG